MSNKNKPFLYLNPLYYTPFNNYDNCIDVLPNEKFVSCTIVNYKEVYKLSLQYF